jgi:hypothetical protein
MKNETEFSKWLKNAAFSGLFRKSDLRLRHIEKIETEVFIVNNEEGNPICLFEVGREPKFPSSVNSQKVLLKKLPPWCLKIPGYVVLYSKAEGSGHREIINFRVRKFMPTERFVGDYSPRQFAGFVASTIAFCRKKYEKENPQ